MLYMGAIGSIQGAFAGSASIMSRLQENVLYYYHYTDLIALPEIRKSNSKYQSIPNLEKGIEFQNVCFRYNIDQPWVLRNVNLLIPANKCLALVGTNGAGKTTLVKILTRLYEPSEGSILWDGVDIREFDPSEFRQRISIVFQDFMRYDLTAQENIGFGDINHLNNIELIRKAARRAGIDELLVKLPQGYQTVLSRWLVEKDKSVDLSGGEWQKVAIARMFMRQSSLFILDEPTASLDSISENEIYNHFIKIANAKTSLIISHRYSTVRRADMVALLDEGSIIEYGAPNLLIAEGKEYAKLFRSHVKKEISSCFEQKT